MNSLSKRHKDLKSIFQNDMAQHTTLEHRHLCKMKEMEEKKDVDALHALRDDILKRMENCAWDEKLNLEDKLEATENEIKKLDHQIVHCPIFYHTEA